MTGFAPPPPPVVPEIDVDELDRVRAEGASVFDVRQPDEYDAGHVPGARLVPLAEVPQRASEFAGGDGGPVYIVCLTGARSARATDFLRRQGVDAINVAGGTKAWVEAGKATARGPMPG